MSSEPVGVRSYRLDRSAFDSTVKPRMRRSLVRVGCIALAVVSGHVVFTQESLLSPRAVPFAIPAVLVLAFVGVRAFRTQVKRQRASWPILAPRRAR